MTIATRTPTATFYVDIISVIDSTVPAYFVNPSHSPGTNPILVQTNSIRDKTK